MRQQLRALTAVLCILCTAGCTSTELLSWKRWKKPDVPKADENNPAVRIVALWEPSEGIGLDKLPTRGFAGQILFFTKGGASPVAVDGKVRIYLYDDDGPAQTRGRPIHQFDFPSESWHAHLLQGMLGPSYHVFIPYTRKDGYRARCSLRVRLTPEHGPVIYSELVHVTLPGPTREGESQNLSQSGKAAVPELLDQPADNKPLGASVAKYRLPLRRVANVSSRGVGQQADLNPGRDPVRPADGTAGRPRLAENNRPQFRHENRIESRSPAGSLRPHATAEHREPALRNEPPRRNNDVKAAYEARLREIQSTIDAMKNSEEVSKQQQAAAESPSPRRFRLTPAARWTGSGGPRHAAESGPIRDPAPSMRHPLADDREYHPLSRR